MTADKQAKQPAEESASRSMATLATTLVQCGAALLLGGGEALGCSCSPLCVSVSDA